MNRVFSLIIFIVCLCGTAADAQQWTQILPSETVDLRDPRAISVSPEGLLYIADTGHHRLLAVDSTGVLVYEAGGFGSGHGQFRWPQDVAASFGNAVWILDYGNRRVEKFSRTLEYQGTVEIVVDDEAPRQPEAITMSPHGDLFVFDRDGGRLLKYDPLFNLQAELGGNTGAEIVTRVEDLTYIPSQGLMWWGTGNKYLERADALLNPAPSYPLPVSESSLILAAIDQCLLYGSSKGLYETCLNNVSPELMLSERQLTEAGIQNVSGLAGSSHGPLYILDGQAGAVFRVLLRKQ